jgi:hypothetical protein
MIQQAIQATEHCHRNGPLHVRVGDISISIDRSTIEQMQLEPAVRWEMDIAKNVSSQVPELKKYFTF